MFPLESTFPSKRFSNLMHIFQITSELLASRVAEGHPARLREVLLVFEAAGTHTIQAREARAQLTEMTLAHLKARLADPSLDIPQLVEAILEAEAEGLSDKATEARTQLPRLVR